MNEKIFRNNVLAGVLAAVAATIIWAGNFIIARGVIKEIPPVTLSFYRWSCATLIILLFAWKGLAKEWATVKKHFFYFLLTAVTGISLFNTFVYIAGHSTGAINMALIGTASSPIMAVLLAGIFLKEKITAERIIGMLICIAGIFLILSKGSWKSLASFSFGKGDWWMLAAGLSFAIYNVAAKKKPVSVSPVHFLFIIFFIGTLVLLPFYVYEYSQQGGFAINLSSTSTILYLGIGASVLSFLLWNFSIEKIGVARTALFGNLIPVFSSIEAVIFLGESVSWVHIASFALVLAGLLIANRIKLPPAKQADLRPGPKG